ncbi:MAG: AAA family ATPase [Anaerolineae bacterium]
MIPLRLYMRNFMCYREQVLDLRGIDLACLTGDNGHGKSAILDAMTWNLWGYSRLGARRDDELIHLGETEMEVEFEFELHQGTDRRDGSTQVGIRYRVLRKRSKRKRGQSSLELQGWDPEAGKFHALSEPTIAATQEQINDLLRMDYETFINSAFLLQGRADEFTIKRPAERKRVLGDILGLQIYERYEGVAKEKAKERELHADQVRATIEQIDRELARETEYRAELAAVEAELARLQEQRERTEAEYDQMRTELQEAESAQRRLADLRRRIEGAEAERARLGRELASHDARLQALEAALSEEVEIEQGFEAYQQAIVENEAMNARLAESASLKERRSDLEQRIAAARHELDKMQYAAAERVRQLEVAAETLDRETEWEEVQAVLTRMDEAASRKEEALTEIGTLSTEAAALLADNKRAEADATQIKEKIALLSGEDEATSEAARCPLCGQPLGDSDCHDLLATFQAQLAAEREAYRERNVQINEKRRRSNELQEVIAGVERTLAQRSDWQRKEAALAHTLQAARQAAQELPAVREQLQAIERRLANDDDAPDLRAALVETERQLGELGYDAATHRRVQAELGRLRPFEARMQTLRDARSSLDTVRLAISQLQGSQAEVDGRLETDRAAAEDLAEVVSQIPDLQRQAFEARRVLETAHDREQDASLRLGAARNKVEYCADLKRQRAVRVQEERQHREEQAIYQDLQAAFSRNGVQAMLIESAIPEIEEEANRLLARMTEGRMQVRFETQRDTKQGNTIETLDIHVTDQLGTRSYETYSGGERYRINFAIRIALSKLLAHRAGAQLQMLVIDEGFGTQDAEGRDGLIDALNAIRDDFACILAITHIQELREAFNVRIEVEKTPQGSQITVV